MTAGVRVRRSLRAPRRRAVRASCAPHRSGT